MFSAEMETYTNLLEKLKVVAPQHLSLVELPICDLTYLLKNRYIVTNSETITSLSQFWISQKGRKFLEKLKPKPPSEDAFDLSPN